MGMAGKTHARVHHTADVSPRADIGEDTQVWNEVQIRDGAIIGRECILGKGVFIDTDVRIGDRCKLQNGVNVYHGAVVEDGVFLGPGVMLLNDRIPRAIRPDGTLKGAADWIVSGVTVRTGAAIGGGAVLLPGITVGRYAMVGAGAIVTHDVPEQGLVYGNPARLAGYVCTCGIKLPAPSGDVRCDGCGTVTRIPPAGKL